MAHVSLFASLKHDQWVKPFLRQYRFSLALALLLGLLMFFCASALMFTSGYLISRAAEMPGNIMLIYVPIVLTRAFGIGRPVFRYAERLTSHNWVLKMTSKLRLKLYTVLEKDAIFFRNLHKTGDMLGLLSESIGHIQNLYLRTIFPTLVAWLVYVVALGALGFFSWWFALMMLVLLGVVVVLVPLVSALCNGARQARSKALRTELYGELADNVLGVSDWLISGRSAEYLLRHQKTQAELRALKESLEASARKRNMVVQALFGLIVVLLLLWAGSYFGASGNGMVNWIAAFVLCFFPLIDAFAPLSDAAIETNEYSDSIARLNALSEEHDQSEHAFAEKTKTGKAKAANTEVANTEAPPPRHTYAPPGVEIHVNGAIEEAPSYNSLSSCTLQMTDVCFSYSEAHLDARPLLRGVNLTIEPGQKIALLGRSGSGKSTLALLLRGDLSPTTGSVTLGGIPTDQYGDDISRFIGVIQQQPYVFNTSLRNNIKLGRQTATDEEVWQALDTVGLRALAERLPRKLDTIIDEAGISFSGGERHRIALARILLQEVPIVILDEPTTGLDLLTEKALLHTMFTALTDKTVLLITHHVLGAQMMDRVLFLEEGIIAIDGAPADLALTNRHYQTLLAFDEGSF